MTDKETRTVVLWQIGATDKAYKFRTAPPEDLEAEELWCPRSICHRVQRQPELNGAHKCVVEIEEWWLEKNDL